MSWRNVKLIYAREIRDQLRDRRTLFMIAVLPLLLYPLIGTSVFQLSQFLRKTEARVVLIGTEQLRADSTLPPLVVEGRFADELFDDPADARRLILETGPVATDEADILASAQARLQSGEIQVVVQFPPDFGQRLEALRDLVLAGSSPRRRGTGHAQDAQPSAAFHVPEPEIIYNGTREKSRLAQHAVERVLDHWKSQIVRQNLLAGRVPVNVARPFRVKPRDVAEPRQQEAAVWAKIVPFVLFIWALTGAFYPAVDLCAGEKERGTLETLLSSPALRSEIVWGKLLTVMTFSVATALLNLGSMGITAHYVVVQLQSIAPGDALVGLRPPPPSAILCLLAALLPMAALFSALCLACAAFARSTKEGQYYLMPLMLVTLPLMMLPMSPGIELNLGNSLIPVTGVVLLLRALMEGHYADALPYIVPVCGMTLICCLLAIRWAVYQFNQESVLFRESERLDLRRWIVHLVRDRQETPSLSAAFFCVALVFVMQFFIGLAASGNVPRQPDFRFLTLLVFVSQVVCFALPALLMTLMFTRSRLRTLLLNRLPNLKVCGAAVLLAVCAHPVGQRLVELIQYVYPLQDGIHAEAKLIEQMLRAAPYAWLPFLLIAVLPAICEEIAFRGFILSGLRHLGHKWWAIGLSAVFFGVAHPVVQQSLAAAVLGLVIGYLAVQSGSLLPCMLFHATYNSLMLVVAVLPQQVGAVTERWPVVKSLFVDADAGNMAYRWPVVLVSGVVTVVILAWFRRLPYQATKEEQLSDARALQSQQLAASSVE